MSKEIPKIKGLCPLLVGGYMKKKQLIPLILTCCILAGCGTQTKNRLQINKSHSTTTKSTESSVIPSSSEEEKAKIDRSKEYVYKNNPNLTPVNYDSPALLGITEDAGVAYRDKLYFICDSPTYWMWPMGLLGGGKETKQIWTGPEGTQTLAYQSTYKILDPYDKKQKLIVDVVKEHKPEYIVIAMGVNGISFMDEKAFTKEYTDLINKIQTVSPYTNILCSSIYPITKAYKHWGSITNDTITKANSWILKIAEDTGVHYIDTYSAIVDDDGQAKKELMMKDGLHPNEEGLKEILNYIRTHAYIPKKK